MAVIEIVATMDHLMTIAIIMSTAIVITEMIGVATRVADALIMKSRGTSTIAILAFTKTETSTTTATATGISVGDQKGTLFPRILTMLQNNPKTRTFLRAHSRIHAVKTPATHYQKGNFQRGGS